VGIGSQHVCVCVSLARDEERAAEQFQIIGDVRTEHPWDYFNQPGLAFAARRQRAYASLPPS